MSAAIAAVAISGIGTIGSMFMSHNASKAAAASSKTGMMMDIVMQQQQLAQQQKMYDEQMAQVNDLEEMFGPIRENLNSYYKNMSPERYQMIGKENIERQFKQADEHVSSLFSNNGMFNSGQAASAAVALEASRADALGVNQQASMKQYHDEQSSWYQFGAQEINAGRNRATGFAGNIATTMGNMGRTFNTGFNNQATQQLGQAKAWGKTANGFMKIGAYGAAGGFKDAFGGKKTLDPASASLSTVEQV